MNTILPQFVDFNQKTAFYNDITFPIPMSLYEFFFLGLLIAIISIILFRVCCHYWKKSDRFSVFWGCMSCLTGFVPMLMLSTFFAMVLITPDENHDYNSSGFTIANTNLMASPHNKKLKPYENYHESNYDVYVDLVNAKPKGINEKYVVKQTLIGYPMLQTIYSGINNKNGHNNEGKKQSIIYLGQMKHGKFVPNYQNAKVVNIFMNYQKYIKRHHLESKFKNHFSFEISQKYSQDNDPVLVVIGDHGFTLHYKNNNNTKDIASN